MIVYDLACEAGHRFEGWFGSSDDFARQQARGLVTCPECGDARIAKAPMAPRLNRKGNQASENPPAIPAPAPVPAPTIPVASPAPAAAGQGPVQLSPEARAALVAIAQAQAEALKTSQWVGRDFAETARAMHYGEQDQSAIHGEASPDEARALHEEGIDIAPVIVPVAPPGSIN